MEKGKRKEYVTNAQEFCLILLMNVNRLKKYLKKALLAAVEVRNLSLIHI